MQPLKHSKGIVSTPSGIVIEVILVPLKQLLPIVRSVDGKIIEVRFLPGSL